MSKKDIKEDVPQEEVVDNAETVEVTEEVQEVEPEVVEEKERGVISPINPEEPFVDYDWRCADCGGFISKRKVLSENEAEDEEEKEEFYCLDCGSTNKEWGFSDLAITCNAYVYNKETEEYEPCGHVTKVDHPNGKNIRFAFPLTLRTNNKQFLGLACEKCKSSIAIGFTPAAEPPSKEEIDKIKAEMEERTNKKPKLEIVKDDNQTDNEEKAVKEPKAKLEVVKD